jgi:cytidylate kinase
MQQTVVAIDGPAGSGKSTVARRLADLLGFVFLPSGKLYRALAWQALRMGTPVGDGDALARLADRAKIDAREEGGTWRFLVDGRDVTEELDGSAVSDAASRISVFPEVRRRMVALQRAMAEEGPVVAEGRDMASVVFPDARHKFFLDASVAARAARRARDLRVRGEEADEAKLAAEIAARDLRDSSRQAAPLRQVEGAVYVDTTNLTVDQVIERLLREIRRGQ